MGKIDKTPYLFIHVYKSKGYNGIVSTTIRGKKQVMERINEMWEDGSLVEIISLRKESE